MFLKVFYCFFPYFRKYRKISKNLDFKDLSNFYPDIKKGRVIKVYDGDSITIASRVNQLKNDTIYKFNIRLNRIDSPEIRTNNIIEKEYAIKIRDLLSEKIMNKMVNIKILKTDKYGRYLAEISYKKININNWLLEHNYAIEYNGSTKKIFDSLQYNNDLSTDIAVAISLGAENIPNRRSLIKTNGEFEI
jgi:endonuclease YncB( thermonuclease family)